MIMKLPLCPANESELAGYARVTLKFREGRFTFMPEEQWRQKRRTPRRTEARRVDEHGMEEKTGGAQPSDHIAGRADRPSEIPSLALSSETTEFLYSA
ncbi:hypothetical protein [Sulfurimicrobium lacus]|uniref:hypothetical protein n=1 Tax=Sulfurimicrobium lacus TaxID=2715678 RepID=UPI001564B7EE|nr:hypothetical protein [Sulfurimicrobium lacus]